MSGKTHTIELDTETAMTLERRAAERGVSVSTLIGNLLQADSIIDEDAELERRWADVESGAVKTYRHGDVVQWLETWGTRAFKPWRDR